MNINSDTLNNFWQQSKAETTTRMSLVVLRLYLGTFYFFTGTNKVFRGDFGLGWQESMVAQVSAAAPNAPVWYGAFLENVVLVYPVVFVILVAWGETLLSIALFFGISTRLAGLMGAFMAMNYSLMSGREIWLPSFDTTLSLALLTLGLARAGRSMGVDHYLAKKWPEKTWLW